MYCARGERWRSVTGNILDRLWWNLSSGVRWWVVRPSWSSVPPGFNPALTGFAVVSSSWASRTLCAALISAAEDIMTHKGMEETAYRPCTPHRETMTRAMQLVCTQRNLWSCLCVCVCVRVSVQKKKMVLLRHSALETQQGDGMPCEAHSISNTWCPRTSPFYSCFLFSLFFSSSLLFSSGELLKYVESRPRGPLGLENKWHNSGASSTNSWLFTHSVHRFIFFRNLARFKNVLFADSLEEKFDWVFPCGVFN